MEAKENICLFKVVFGWAESLKQCRIPPSLLEKENNGVVSALLQDLLMHKPSDLYQSSIKSVLSTQGIDS